MDYYVYAHYLGSDMRYVSIGKGPKAWDFSDRTEEWLKVFQGTTPLVRILRHGLSERDVYRACAAEVVWGLDAGFDLINQTEDLLSLEQRLEKTKLDILLQHKELVVKNSTKPRPVICLETGATYASGEEAARATGLDSSGIMKVCRGQTGSCHGSTWKFVKEDADGQPTIKVRKYDKTQKFFPRKRRPVIFKESGVRYPSITDAARKTGISHSTIWSACQDRINGEWSYATE